jgi:hypothetical protein
VLAANREKKTSLVIVPPGAPNFFFTLPGLHSTYYSNVAVGDAGLLLLTNNSNRNIVFNPIIFALRL